MTSKEYFLPLKRTDYFLYCGEKLISVNWLKTNDSDQEREPLLLLIFTKWHFQRLITQTFVVVDMYVKCMYAKYEIKPHEINRYTILRHYIVVAYFSFFFFFLSRMDIVFRKRIWKKEKNKKRVHERDRSYISETREKFDKKGGEQSIHPFVKKKIKEKNGNRIKRTRQSIVM